MLFILFALQSQARDHGDEWLQLSGHVEDNRPWWIRLANSTSLYIDAGPQKPGEITMTGWTPAVEGGYGAGLQWRIEF